MQVGVVEGCSDPVRGQVGATPLDPREQVAEPPAHVDRCGALVGHDLTEQRCEPIESPVRYTGGPQVGLTSDEGAL